MQYKLGILGAGVMSSAILKNIDLSNAAVCDLSPQKTEMFLEKGATFISDPKELIAASDTVFLGIKPQNALEIFENCDFSNVKYIISILAGVKIQSIISKINQPQIGILRVMPNLPAKIGKGVSALCFHNIPKEVQERFQQIFESCGSTLIIKEEMFDTITSISGSGPAYVYLFLDAMIKGGIDGGLDYESAKKLAIDTVIGAAFYAKNETVPMNEMVERVCSKGGTTIEAIEYYRQKDFVNIVKEGIKRCKDKSTYLSEQTK